MKHALFPVPMLLVALVAMVSLGGVACDKKKPDPGPMPADPCKASVDRMIRCTRKKNPKFADKMAKKRDTMLELCATNELSNRTAKKCARIRGCDAFLKCLDSDD